MLNSEESLSHGVIRDRRIITRVAPSEASSYLFDALGTLEDGDYEIDNFEPPMLPPLK